MHFLLAIYNLSPHHLQPTRDARSLIVAALLAGHKLTLFTASPTAQLPAQRKGLNIVRPFVDKGAMEPHPLMLRRFAKAFAKEVANGCYDATIALDEIPGADFHISYRHGLLHGELQPLNFLDSISPAASTRRKLEEQLFLPPSITKICCATDLQRLILSKHYGLHANRLEILPPHIKNIYALPTDEVRAQIRKEVFTKLEIDEGCQLILTCTTHWDASCLENAMTALATMPESILKRLRLLVICPHGSLERLRQLAVQCKLNPETVLFLADHSWRHNCYIAADLMLYPALHENSAPPVMEALSTGLPVICTAACGFCNYVQAAGCPVIPMPYHNETLVDALAFSLPQLDLLSRDVTNFINQQDFSNRYQQLLNMLVNFKRPADKSLYFTPKRYRKIIEQHRKLLANHEGLKDDRKRAITRVKLDNHHSFIVKEFKKAPWWHLRSQVKRTMRGTALMRSYTPYCWGNYHDNESGSDFLIFPDCGTGNFYQTDYAKRPDAKELYFACGVLLAQLHTSGIFHADTKPTNFVRNEFCKDECPEEVCLIDCDNVKRHTPPLSLPLRIFNCAQFIAGTGKLAKMDYSLWYSLVDQFRKGYTRNSKLARADGEQFWLQVWAKVRHDKKIENNLPS